MRRTRCCWSCRPGQGAPGKDPARRQFQALFCAIDGALVIGMRCAELLPAHATIQIRGHNKLQVTRARTFEHPDDFPVADFPSPYAPACCNYKGCQGKTIQYSVDSGNHGLDDEALIGVWPPDADVGFDHVTDEEDAKFTRGRHSQAAPDLRFRLLSTTDVDHDGHREHVVYAPEANNYGIEVLLDDPKAQPVYEFSCGDG